MQRYAYFFNGRKYFLFLCVNLKKTMQLRVKKNLRNAVLGIENDYTNTVKQ
jgi:hypothetical protein